MRKADLKIPSDLFGMTPLMYESGEPDTLATRIAPVANQLREIIKEGCVAAIVFEIYSPCSTNFFTIKV